MAVSVVNVVRWAIEFLQSGGVGAVQYGAGAAGWRDGFSAAGRIEANRLNDALIQLPPCELFAMLAQVHAEDIRQGPVAWMELCTFVRSECPQSFERFGPEAGAWLVRKWMRPDDGSWREFARLFDTSPQTGKKFFIEVVKPLIDSWFVVAKGVLEVVIDEVFGDELPIAA
ncbi:hypothetical protein [Chromobacterium subtsugae]|uniref:hypothetical protein n=1 Tax=Chromobacterium subtsugae TaxID=251747 RepID=UPI0006415DE9|nr:hypothetical protein [Chromobacterium subtsugae]